MDQPPFPRKRVRMKCAFGHLSVCATAPDDDIALQSQADWMMMKAARFSHPPRVNQPAATPDKPPQVTVRRRKLAPA
jgi:hypothetical protein